jgi:hypothetical protein
VLGETEADSCTRGLDVENDLLISAGTVAEALIVSACSNVGEEMARLIGDLGFEIGTVSAAPARRVALSGCAAGLGGKFGLTEASFLENRALTVLLLKFGSASRGHDQSVLRRCSS